MANTGNTPNFVQKTRHNSPLGPGSPPQKENGTSGTQDLQKMGEIVRQADDRAESPKHGNEIRRSEIEVERRVPASTGSAP